MEPWRDRARIQRPRTDYSGRSPNGYYRLLRKLTELIRENCATHTLTPPNSSPKSAPHLHPRVQLMCKKKRCVVADNFVENLSLLYAWQCRSLLYAWQCRSFPQRPSHATNNTKHSNSNAYVAAVTQTELVTLSSFDEGVGQNASMASRILHPCR